MNWLRVRSILLILALAGVATGPVLAGPLVSSVSLTSSTTVARVVVLLPGGLAQDWHIDGIGTETVTVTLPRTALGPGLQIDRPPVGGVLQSVSALASAAGVRVILRLNSNQPVVAHPLGSALVLDIGTPATAVAQGATVHAAAANTAYTVITLKYADVSEVANILTQGQLQPTDVFHATASAFALPSSGGASGSIADATASLQAAPATIGERLTDGVAIDRRLNALVVSGTPEQIASIRDLVAQLDIPVDSVMLDCQIVELTESSARDLGLEFSQGSGDPIGQGSLTLGNNSSTGLTGSGVSATFAAQLYATIARGGGKVLATPRILAIDGASAQILAGNAIPIIQSTIYPGATAITQVSTNYLTVGINLEILPRIRGDNNVESHVYAEVSSVTAYVTTAQGSVPEVSLRRASTDALVREGRRLLLQACFRTMR